MTTKSNAHLPPIKIIGSGALGSLFAAFLEPHCDIEMLSHWPQQIEAIRSEGLLCLDIEGSATRHEFTVTNNAHDLEPVRLALVLVKSYQTAQAAFELAPVLAPDGMAITLQNGLGNYEMLESALGHGRVVQGVTAEGATMLGPGRVRHAGHGPTFIASLPGKERLLSDFVSLLNKAGFNAESSPDVRSLQWGKLAVNAGINPLTAILRVQNGFLVEHDGAKSMMCAAAREAERVAWKSGIALPYTDAAARVSEVARATAGNYSSMLQDVLRGAPTEIDAISGAVASYGREAGVPTPVNDALWREVTGIKAGSFDNAVDVDKTLDNLLNSL